MTLFINLVLMFLFICEYSKPHGMMTEEQLRYWDIYIWMKMEERNNL